MIKIKCPFCSGILGEKTLIWHSIIDRKTKKSIQFEAPCYECPECFERIFTERDANEVFGNFEKALMKVREK